MVNNNIAYIFQPHFKTSRFRAAVKEQQGEENNFIVVTCSPMYNGVWKYKAENKSNYSIWMNGRLPCYEVPIDDCVKIKELGEITNEFILNKVREQQQMWWKNEVKNRDYEYKEMPEWLI